MEKTEDGSHQLKLKRRLRGETQKSKPILDNRGPNPARKFDSPPKLFMLLESYEVFLGMFKISSTNFGMIFLKHVFKLRDSVLA